MKRQRLTAVLVAGILVVAAGLEAAEYHVSPDGDDANPGSADAPFCSIQQAADAARAGDTVVIHGSTYREAVELTRGGTAGRPITFAAAPGERVVLSGADPLAADWLRHDGHVFKTQTPIHVPQVFIDGELMIEARWPNMSLERLWDRGRWARAGEGSRYGKMVDPKLAKTGIDWTGAVATLNVAHQFYTWTRRVKRHSVGTDTFEYDQDLKGITHYADKTIQWEDDRYYLTGKLEALDAPGEWFYDRTKKTLYLWPPDGETPAARRVEVKTRHYGFRARKVDHVELRGLHLFACAFHFDTCNHVTIDHCHVRYPNAARRLFGDTEADEFDKAETAIIGDDNRVTRCSLAWGPTSGLRISGRRNLVEDCLMHDFCWDGSLMHPLLTLRSRAAEPAEDRCRVRYCTLYNCGNAIVDFRGPGNIIEYNHVHDGGLCCYDVALVYTGLPTCAGSVVRYNWVHGCYTERVVLANRKLGALRGGLGIRGDDQTRSLTVHHNVVWNCGRDGIIVKGDHNRVYNNTVLNIGSLESTGNYIELPTRAEPKKWWRKQDPLLDVQNQHSRIANNVARTICDVMGRPHKFPDNMSNNYTGERPLLEDAESFRFWPKDGSPLVDAGTPLPGFTDGFHGAAPDIGAYEYGAEPWVPGIRWDPGEVLGYTPRGFVSVR